MGKVLSGSLSVVLYKQILLSLCVCTGNVGFRQQKKGRNKRWKNWNRVNCQHSEKKTKTHKKLTMFILKFNRTIQEAHFVSVETFFEQWLFYKQWQKQDPVLREIWAWSQLHAQISLKTGSWKEHMLPGKGIYPNKFWCVCIVPIPIKISIPSNLLHLFVFKQQR